MAIKKTTTKKKAPKEEEAPVKEFKKTGPFVSPPKPKPVVAVAKAEPVVVEEEQPKKKVAAKKKEADVVEEKKAAPAPKVEAKHAAPAAPIHKAKPVEAPKHVAPAKPKTEHHFKKEAPKPAPAPFKRPEPVRPQAPAPQPMRAPSPVASAPAEAPSSRKKIQFNEMMAVKDLATAMDVKVGDLIKKLLGMGTAATINQRLDPDVAALIAAEFNFDLELKSIYDESAVPEVEDPAKLKPRPPVVTVMGHVDHGKTSLLDAIRSATVASGEAGGITQHIGAYQVKMPKGTITFLDTPGHEAFTAMRARGAKATDLVILVVGADDSVMPQTIEAIDHARVANVPIVVAINKVDLPVANVQRVKQELAQHNLVAEDWGGKTVMVEVSAKTKKNIDKLLEMILLETELLELKANPDRPAKGVVLEAKMDPKRGIVATVLIQAGTLKVGDIVVCGLTSGRVRAMFDENWKAQEVGGPSTPVALLGLTGVPQVGDQLSVVTNDREAREIAERRRMMLAESSAKGAGHLSLESLHDQIEEGKIQELKVIIKADVQGSLGAIQDSFQKISGKPILIKSVHAAVGNINESDVLLAEASDAIVFGFNVKVEGDAETEAKRAGVDLRTYKIIYEMLADVKAAMEGLLRPEEREVVKGKAVVKTMFPSSRTGRVAGCMISEGKVVRGQKARVLRGGKVVASGTIGSLKRFKEDVKEVEKGYECGLGIEGVNDYQPNDIIEVFVIEKHARRLDG